MRRRAAHLCCVLLLVIHTLDMELTRHYIGSAWAQEIFWPMSQCIRHLGIYTALWVSRALIYGLVWLYFRKHECRWAQEAMILGAVLYWAAMAPWLDNLNLLW